ncbi:MAG: carboxymuconolactone decarboxylase family protein [Nocardioides sp.]|nr:carboxymuconolactone decarboxylase family protein [Nocardioides sp.]
MITTRAQFHEALPDTFKRLLNLNQHVERMAEEHQVSLLTLELVKIRCSQINGCAYCADLHIGRALEFGEQHRRIEMLPNWRETVLYSEQERAALGLAESISRLALTQEVSDAVYDEAARIFGEQQLAVVVWAIAEIQAFNALNVTSRKPITTP